LVITVVVITVGETDITVGTFVVTVEEEWFVTVVGAWWGGFAVQEGQTQPSTSPRKCMDLKAGPGCPEQVEWTHLLQQLHWIEVSLNLTGADGARIFGIFGRTGAGPGLVDTAAHK